MNPFLLVLCAVEHSRARLLIGKAFEVRGIGWLRRGMRSGQLLIANGLQCIPTCCFWTMHRTPRWNPSSTIKSCCARLRAGYGWCMAPVRRDRGAERDRLSQYLPAVTADLRRFIEEIGKVSFWRLPPE